MTGEEFLAALEPIQDVRRLTANPTDTIVLVVHEHISPENYERLLKMAREVFKNNSVLILDGGMDLGVLDETTAAWLEFSKTDS